MTAVAAAAVAGVGVAWWWWSVSNLDDESHAVEDESHAVEDLVEDEAHAVENDDTEVVKVLAKGNEASLPPPTLPPSTLNALVWGEEAPTPSPLRARAEIAINALSSRMTLWETIACMRILMGRTWVIPFLVHAATPRPRAISLPPPDGGQEERIAVVFTSGGSVFDAYIQHMGEEGEDDNLNGHCTVAAASLIYSLFQSSLSTAFADAVFDVGTTQIRLPLAHNREPLVRASLVAVHIHTDQLTLAGTPVFALFRSSTIVRRSGRIALFVGFIPAASAIHHHDNHDNNGAPPNTDTSAHLLSYADMISLMPTAWKDVSFTLVWGHGHRQTTLSGAEIAALIITE